MKVIILITFFANLKELFFSLKQEVKQILQA